MSARKKRTVLTVSEKVAALDKLAAGADQATVADEYGVTVAAVSLWKKSERSLRERWEEGQVKAKSSKLAKYQKVDKALNVWFKERRAENTPVNQILLSTQAKVFAEKLGMTLEMLK